MKHIKMSIWTAALLCAGLLTACGDDSSAPQDTDLSAETTTTAETTAPETTTSGAETTSAADTTDAETETMLTTAETEETTAETTEMPSDDTPDEPAQTDAPQTQEKLIWDELKIGGSVADYLAANGGYSFEEADSCIGDGKDRVYTYADRILMTYFENGSEELVELDITAAGIRTRKGIGVGAAVGDVQTAYGAPDGMGMYVFSTEDGMLEFITDGNTVTSIALYAE